MSIEKQVQEIGPQLLKHEWKLAVAESCTGGGLAYYITSIPGSSAWFDRGFVTYSNSAKEEALDVSFTTLSRFGAVSEAVVREMAEGTLRNSQAQISAAITGIAGPDGGSIEKPVGTVWFAWAGISFETITVKKVFSGDRQSIREQAIHEALTGLLQII